MNGTESRGRNPGTPFSSRNVCVIHTIFNFTAVILKKEKGTGVINIIIHLISLTRYTILSFQHAINIQIINTRFHVLFFYTMPFPLTAHLNLDLTHFKN